MTWFLRQAFLVLVAFAALAIIVMMAITTEAKDLKPNTVSTEVSSPADAKSVVGAMRSR